MNLFLSETLNLIYTDTDNITKNQNEIWKDFIKITKYMNLRKNYPKNLIFLTNLVCSPKLMSIQCGF